MKVSHAEKDEGSSSFTSSYLTKMHLRHFSLFLLAVSALCSDTSSSCLKIKDTDTCSSSNDDLTGEACVWCICGAIPSECVSASMAKKLPSAVFKCNAPRDVPTILDTLFRPEPKAASLSSIMGQAPAIFSHWKESQSRQYSSGASILLMMIKEFGIAEETERYEIFKRTLLDVASHNLDGTRPYQLGLNRFSDISWEEFSANWLGANSAGQNCSATHTGESKMALHGDLTAPIAIDWREMGAVSPVKDQGQCGSCWTFSTTGCLESHHYLKTGEMVLLSEQQLVDCAQDFDNNGCNGGLPSHAFEYIHAAGGLDTEEAYPYLARDDSCAFMKDSVGATVIASINITFQDESELELSVGTVGPVAVAFEVFSDFKNYAGGVYDNPSCDTTPDKVNHAVLAVGFDTDSEAGDYWIIKNSWGAEWGEEGYFKMSRGKNMCGIADCASYPLV